MGRSYRNAPFLLVFMAFPCWRYHRTEPARIFRSADELAEAGAGWFDSPSKVEAALPGGEDFTPDRQEVNAEAQQAFTAVKKGRRK